MSVRVDGVNHDQTDESSPHFRRLRSGLARFTAATVVAGLMVTSMTLAAPANAADASVMIKTQRMKDANLNSGQVGWYEKGSRVTLLCWKRGQKVKGFFSFNIPNGGWDDLWYRTSDNDYVADVDIQTGTLNAVGPDCGNFDAPKPQQQQQQQPAASGYWYPVDGNPPIVQGFGVRPLSYQPQGHDGIDIGVTTGTPVYAIADGKIFFEGNGADSRWMLAIAGISVLIDHGSFYSGYAHLRNTVIDNGQSVKRGQLIGYSGATSSMPIAEHLHFEILGKPPNWKLRSGRIDPTPYLGQKH